MNTTESTKNILEGAVKGDVYAVLSPRQANLALAALRLVQGLYVEDGEICAEPDDFTAYFRLRNALK